MPLSIVAVNAHQDDEMASLGTLIRCRERGDRVAIVAISRGDKGGQYDPDLPGEEMARQRRAEAMAVADGIGAEYHCLEADDAFIQDTPAIRTALVRVLRQVRADVIITTPPTDYSSDHLTTSAIATQAALLGSLSPLLPDVPPLDRPPAVFYMDSIAGLDFQPTIYVDISEQWARKAELLRHHVSQMQAMEDYLGWDLVTQAETLGRFRGLQCGTRYAEGFRPVLRDGLLRPGSPLP